MAGIYIHIPFCRKACHYCNFHFSTQLDNLEELVEAIRYEIKHRSDFLSGEVVETIYLGGGTPSVLSAEKVQLLLQDIRDHYKLSHNPEITLEGNPDDLSPEYLLSIKQAGINRLSIGVQSFAEEALAWMNRSHTAEQSEVVINAALQAGFQDISIDLIYGLPDRLAHHWPSDVQKALQYELTHYSCYALTVEPRTALAHQIAHKGQSAPSDLKQQSDFTYLMGQMSSHHYEHYEISNFARQMEQNVSHRSRHNSAYWTGASYLGIGPGAHSYDGTSRYWNISNNSLYSKNISQPDLLISKEKLTPADKYNEYVMTALRHIDGLSMKRIKNFHSAYLDHLLTEVKSLPDEWIKPLQDGFRLTAKGRHYADRAASQLFYVSEES